MYHSAYPVVEEKKATSWIPANDDTFDNLLIDAYLSGKKAGVEQYKMLEISKMQDNIEKSGIVAVGIVDTLKSNKFTPIDAYLRANSFYRFDLLVAVPEDEFLKEEFLYIYDVISEVETKSKDEFYSISISICSTNSYFDEQTVISDGYSLKLEKQ